MLTILYHYVKNKFFIRFSIKFKKQGGAMKLMRIFLVVIVVGMMSACGGAERKADKSQAEINKEKIKISEEYQKCLKNAKGDKDKEAGCEQYLKAGEALK
jgi:hypothetical protein